MDDYPHEDLIFPAGLNKVEAIKSTKLFAYSRLRLDIQEKIAKADDNLDFPYLVNMLCNPVLFQLAEVYPLPLSYKAIAKAYSKKDWQQSYDHKGFMPRPFVESYGDYAGWAYKVKHKDTIGWFIGLVVDLNQIKMQELIDSGIPNPRLFFDLFINTQYKFVEGMILLEGKLDEAESVIRDLRAYEKIYNKNILGKVITGRPISDDYEWSLNEARAKLKKNPKLKQQILVDEIGISLRSFQNHIKRANYANFKAFKDSVLKP